MQYVAAAGWGTGAVRVLSRDDDLNKSDILRLQPMQLCTPFTLIPCNDPFPPQVIDDSLHRIVLGYRIDYGEYSQMAIMVENSRSFLFTEYGPEVELPGGS